MSRKFTITAPQAAKSFFNGENIKDIRDWCNLSTNFSIFSVDEAVASHHHAFKRQLITPTSSKGGSGGMYHSA